MPLVQNQDIIVIAGPELARRGGGLRGAAVMLREKLETYPPCRIMSISTTHSGPNYTLTAVVEMI